MQRLEQEDFVLPWREQQAFAVLASTSERPVRLALEQSSAATDEEDRLRAEVAEFAAAFFSLASDERAGRWKALHAKCAWHPVLRAWLHDLKRGLELAMVRVDGALQEQLLADAVAELFVLRGNERLASLIRPRTLPAHWEAAARQLQIQASRIRNLGPSTLKELVDWCQRRARTEGGSKGKARRSNNAEFAAVLFAGFMIAAMIFGGMVVAGSRRGSVSVGPGIRQKYDERVGKAMPSGTEPRPEANSTSQTPRKP